MAEGKLFYGTRHYTIPLRAAWAVSRTKRAKRAMAEIKIFVARHMKLQEDEEIWIDTPVNEKIWERGIQKPPRRVHIRVNRFEGDDRIEVSLDDAKYVTGGTHRAGEFESPIDEVETDASEEE